VKGWLAVAGVGFVLSIVGFTVLVERYRRKRIDLKSLLAYFVGYVSFVSYALLVAFKPDIATGAVTLITLAPAFAAIVWLVHLRRKP
jgi:hypothetical protein